MAEATKARTAKAEQAAPPRSVYRHPARLDAVARVEELKLQRDELTARIEGHNELQSQRRFRGTKGQAAAALLDGESIEDLVSESHVEDLRRLHHQRELVREAIDLAEKRLTAVETKLSAAIIADVLPDYRQLIERQRVAAMALVEVIQEEAALINGLAEDGVLLGQLTRLTYLHPSEAVCRFNQFAREARSLYGIEIREIPEEA
jgi:hypothetical protein